MSLSQAVSSWQGPQGRTERKARIPWSKERVRVSTNPSVYKAMVVPDVTELFYRACMEVAGRLGLHVAPIRLTPHPMPVDGLVVGQTPAPGERVHRDSTLTVQVWHPSEPGGQQPPAD